MTFTKIVFLGGLAAAMTTATARAQVSGPYIAAAAGANFRQ